MKIGIFDPYLDDLGGGEKYMMTIAEALSANHQVAVFWDNPSDLEPLLKRFSLDLTKVKIVKNIFKPSVSFLSRFLESRKYDALIVLSDGSIPLVLSKKLFIHIQQPLDQMQTESLINKIKLSRVTSFFSNSEYTKSFLDKKFNIQVKVLYPPVSIHAKQIKKENHILHVGRFRIKNVKGLDDYKKQKVMISVFKDMVDKGLTKWKFILAASVNKDDEKTFQELINDAKSYPIDFLINKTNKELWDAYSSSKIYWHASGFGEDLEKHPEFAEHFGISTVEAMGAGVVPVVINAGGQKEIVENGKNGYLWNSLPELELQTLELIQNPVLLEKISKQAVISSKRFSKEKFVENLENLIIE